MNFTRKKRAEIEINTIPIINIVFLLLIFFIVTGTLKNTDVIPIDAPLSKSGEEVFTDPIEILIGENEIIYDLELVSEKELGLRLQSSLKLDAKIEIMLKADADLEAKRLVDVLKVVRKAGVTNLYLITNSPF